MRFGGLCLSDMDPMQSRGVEQGRSCTNTSPLSWVKRVILQPPATGTWQQPLSLPAWGSQPFSWTNQLVSWG